MKTGADDGDVFDFEDFDINDTDTIETLYFKNSIVTARMIQRSLPRLLDGTMELKPQAGQPTYYARRSEQDGEIDWESFDVWKVDRMVRALTKPYPGAFGRIDGRQYRIWRGQVFDTRIHYPGVGYGKIVERFEGKLILNCLGGLYLMEHFEPL